MSDAPETSAAPVSAPVDSGAAVSGDVSQATPTTTQSAPVAAVPTGAPAASAADDAWPTVEWDSWDGEVDTLPDQYHDTARGMSQFYNRRSKENDEEIGTLRAMYAAMLDGDEDPRVGQLNTKLEELQKKFDDRNTEYQTLEETFHSAQDAQAQEYVKQFWQKNSELAQDPAKLERFALLLEDHAQLGGTWDGDVAAELVYMSNEAVEAAIVAKKEGVPDAYALKLAKAHAKLEEVEAQPSPEEVKAAQVKAKAEAKAKAPRTGAKITNGATRASRPQMAKKSMGDASSLDDLRVLAARRAFSVHGGGRK
tara:strand:+ start:1194 stop:2123 length:930 start_codon:yes stop_codon:yes gene_type:complete